jgi:hypothetical protein
MRKLLSILIALTLAGNFYLAAEVAFAAPLTGLADYLSNLKVSEKSNHDIRFRFPTGMSSGNIVIDFNTASFDTTGVVFGDVDLFYGSSNDPSTGVAGNCSSSCTNATLAASAGAAAWGVGNSSNSITLSYPTSGGTAIAADDYVRIKIGTNAAGPGTHQITNPGTTGGKTVTINAGDDDGRVSIVMINDSQLGIGATVDPTLSFSISSTTINFGHFTSTNVRYATTDLNGSTTEPGNGEPVVLAAGTNAAKPIPKSCAKRWCITAPSSTNCSR